MRRQAARQAPPPFVRPRGPRFAPRSAGAGHRTVTGRRARATQKGNDLGDEIYGAERVGRDRSSDDHCHQRLPRAAGRDPERHDVTLEGFARDLTCSSTPSCAEPPPICNGSILRVPICRPAGIRGCAFRCSALAHHSWERPLPKPGARGRTAIPRLGGTIPARRVGRLSPRQNGFNPRSTSPARRPGGLRRLTSPNTAPVFKLEACRREPRPGTSAEAAPALIAVLLFRLSELPALGLVFSRHGTGDRHEQTSRP